MNRLYFADERRFACLFVLWRSAEGTPAWKKSKQVLFIRSLIRTLAIAEGTSARKSSNKFGISLAYSYLCIFIRGSVDL
jgi:hypothetical protein